MDAAVAIFISTLSAVINFVVVTTWDNVMKIHIILSANRMVLFKIANQMNLYLVILQVF